MLPPSVDRTLALSVYDGTQKEDQGGPSYAAVVEDLRTPPFLTERRVVMIRDADAFITAARDKLENYVDNPSKVGTLILECRSFPKTTRLAKAIAAAGGRLVECRKLRPHELAGWVVSQTRARKRQVDPATAARIVELVGPSQGLLVAEIDKLCLYAGERATITDDDVRALVGQSREEMIFAALDAAVAGRLPDALKLWHQVLAGDPAARFKAVGGVAFKLRKWLAGYRMAAQGMPIRAIAPQVMMWGREQELGNLMRRISEREMRRQLADLAELDAQAKSGARSIEMGVEAMLIRLASPAA